MQTRNLKIQKIDVPATLFLISTLLTGCFGVDMKESGLSTSSVSSSTPISSSAITSVDRGSTWDLTTAFPGAGLYTSIAPALSAADICSTKTFLGVVGTAICNTVVPAPLTFTALMPSTAFRADNSTINLATLAAVNARVQPLLDDEIAGNSTFTVNSALIANPHVDTDGRYGASGVVVKRNYLATVKGRPTFVCGLTGTNDQRVADCAVQNTSAGVNKALYEGAKYGQAGESNWSLITLYKAGGVAGDSCATGFAGACYEVWRDERTKLIWSDLHHNNSNDWNWFQAAGFARSASTAADTFYEGGTPATTGLTYSATSCHTPGTTTCQGNVPVSVCADATAIANTNGISTYQNPDGSSGSYDERPAKGNHVGAAFQWRLPTIDDWNLANVDGVRKVLPNMDYIFWSSTSVSNGKDIAWNFSGDIGITNYAARDSAYAVRCVGR